MKNVYIEYNPFLVETKITVDGKNISQGGKLESKLSTRLQSWIDILLPELEKTECNDDITLQFKGTELDWSDIKSAIEDYEKRGGMMRITLKEPELVRGGPERLQELIALFNEMQKNCPFDDLKTEDIRKNFERAISAEFEVSVIATMSSGKSTLINALLGRELVPSKASACTATVAHIKDVDEMENFTAKCCDKDGKIIETNNDLTADSMSKYNDTERITDIYIEGDIPFASSKDMQLVLIDTPGPNNSRTDEHQKRTYRVIKSDAMPMVMYIMNATQLFTNDDESLVRAVSDAIKSQHGKQARDRFIFVINKADTLDPEVDGTIEDAIQNAKSYLKDKGIEDANIYPVSAEIAKLIRIHENYGDENFSKVQKRNLRNSPDIFEESEMHLENYAPLSVTVHNSIVNELTKAKAEGDEYAETLIHTGIPAVEAAIVEYMNKYALSSKIKDAVDTFKNKIEEKEIMGNLEKEWVANDEERQRVSKQWKYLSSQLEQGKQAEKFREKIEALDLTKEANKKLVRVTAKCNSAFNLDDVLNGDGMIDPQILLDTMNDMKRRIPNLEKDIQTDLEKIIDDAVVKNAQKIMQEYKEEISALIKENEVNMPGFNFDVAVKVLTVNLPSVNNVVDQYTETKTKNVKVGEKKVSDSHWYNPFSWGKHHYEDIIEKRDYQVADGKKAISDYFIPVRQNMLDNINSARDVAVNQSNQFKNYFISEIEKLDELMKKKAREMEEASSNKEKLAAKVKEDERKMEWLENFIKKLDSAVKI